MSGGGSSGTQVTTQRTEPWDQQRPYLLTGFERASGLLNGQTPQYYPQSTVTPFTNLQERAMRETVNRADAGSPVLRAGQNAAERAANGGVPGLQSTISGNFLGTDPSATNLGAYGRGDFGGTGFGSALNSAATGGFGNLAGGSALQSAATGGFGNLAGGPALNQAAGGSFGNLAGGSTLANTAGGSYLNANPHLDATYNRAANAVTRNFNEGVMPSIDAAMARAGRFGSPGAHGNAVDTAQYNLGRSLTDLGTGIYGGAYGQERGLQQQAAQGLLGSQLGTAQGLLGSQLGTAEGLLGTQLGTAQGLLGSQMAATGQQQGAYDAERNRMLQASSQDAATRLQAAGMAPQLGQADYNDLQAKMGIGTMRQGQEEARTADDIARWNFEQSREADQLARYMGMIGGGYGTTSQTAQPLYNNRMSGGLGGALAGGTLGGSIGGPWGAGIGALGGGLAGLFG